VTEYVIAPEDEPDWRFTPEDFAARIRARWTQARTGVNDLEDSPMVVHALISFPPPRRELGVALSNLGYAVVLDPADPATAGEFVEWYVGQIPTFDPPVLLFTEDYEKSLPLHPSITREQIDAFLTQL
jgi:hypothetical protein